jgi:hypothetical protein
MLPEIEPCEVGFHAVSNICNIEPDGYDIDPQSIEHIGSFRIERKCRCFFTGALAPVDDVFDNFDGIGSIGVRYWILSK